MFNPLNLLLLLQSSTRVHEGWFQFSKRPLTLKQKPAGVTQNNILTNHCFYCNTTVQDGP